MAGLIGSRFVQICVDDSANRLPDTCRMVVEGPVIDESLLTAAEIAELAPYDQLIRVRNEEVVNKWFGTGSVLSEGLKVAMNCCRTNPLEIYALPRQNAGAGAVYEATVTGTATSNGVFNIYWGEERYGVNLSVTEGETAEDIAAKLVDNVPDEFFFTATATGAVITFTAKNGGSYGHQLYYDFNWQNRDSGLPEGVSISLTRVVPGTVEYPRYDDYETAMGNTCCACCFVHLSSAAEWQAGALDYVESTWECEKPGCMTLGYAYGVGSPEAVLGLGNNYLHSAILAHCNNFTDDASEGDPIFPWMKLAAYGAKSCCIVSTNPETSIEGPNQGVLDCVAGPSSCSSCYDFEDKKELNEAGFVTTSAVGVGDGFMTSPFIDTDISNGLYDDTGRRNRTWEDMNSSRLARATAQRVYEQLLQFQGLALFSSGTKIRSGVRGTSPAIVRGKLRAWFKDNVGILFSEPYNINEQITVVQESETLPECYGDPRKLLVRIAYQPPLRIADMKVTLRPEFDPLCQTR